MNKEEYLKCKNDPIYFIEQYIDIPSPDSGEPIKLKMYEPQKELLSKLDTDHCVVCLKTRQMGLSTLSRAHVVHSMIFYPNISAGIIVYSQKSADNFLYYISMMIDRLPDIFGIKVIRNFSDNIVLNNGSKVKIVPISNHNSCDPFIGTHTDIVVIDEASQINRIETVFGNIIPRIFLSHRESKRLGKPYSLLITGTPNKKTKTGKWFYELWQETNKQKENMLKSFQVLWIDVDKFANDPNWYKDMCEALQNDPKAIAQELNGKFVD